MSQHTLYSFIFELPLYNKIKIPKSDTKQIWDIIKWQPSTTVDGYNIGIKQMTTWKVDLSNEKGAYGNNPEFFLGHCRIVLKCVRTDYEMRVYSFMEEHDDNYVLFKVGQYPSIADLHISQLRQYDNVLPREKMKEFTRAIGIAANGVGIGSFVYLRRVFEYLIEEAHQAAINDEDWIEEEYERSRMVDKILMLKSRLPDFLVEHKEMYGILSKGVHELTEDECLDIFEPMKIGIEIILDAKVDELNRQKKIKEASQRIKDLQSKLGNKA